MNTPTILNLALLFEAEHNEVFTRLSHEIKSRCPIDFALGEHSLPHLTILQFEAERDAAHVLWKALGRTASSPVSLDLFGLTFIPSKEGHMWVEISVLKTDRLMSIQNAAADIVIGRKIHSGTKDAFRPHITVARMGNSTVLVPINLDDQTVRRKNVSGRLGLGLSGANYQFEELLYG